jgi:tripartite ATP-independent transporter DctP family solute receptor
MTMPGRNFAATAVAATAGFVLGVVIGAMPASAADKIIRVGSSDPMSSPYMMGMSVFKRIVEQRSGGSMEVQIFPSGQLGQQVEQLEGVRAGTQEINLATPAWFSAFFPQIEVLELPFLVNDWDAATRLFESDVMGEVVADAEKESGIRIAGWMPVGFRNVFNKDRPVEKIEDLAGMKIRLQNAAVHIATFKALGANPVALAYSEVYPGLQTGVIDAAESPSGQIVINKFYEVGPYVSQTQHFFAAMLVYVNSDFYGKLTPAEKEIFDDAMVAAEGAGYVIAKQNEDDAMAQLTKLGAKVNVPSDAEKQRMIEAVSPIYQEFAPKLEKYLDRVLKVARGS